MLWKKESRKQNALYTNLLAPSIDHWDPLVNMFVVATFDQQPHSQKSDAYALQKRNEGNEKFRARNWLDAIESYGDSLRFAQPKSEHVSLAYANRAACFLSLKMFQNCLKDIELATDAGYPKHLMPKLEERKKNCLKQMQEDAQPERKLLITEPDDQFPYLFAKVAEVRKSDNGDYSVFAKTDIDVGQTLIIEDSYEKCLLSNFGSTCNIW